MDFEEAKDELTKKLVKDSEFICEDEEYFIYYDYLKEWNKRFNVNGNFTDI